jgi:Cellulase (glycosyl hydrolase family 5)
MRARPALTAAVSVLAAVAVASSATARPPSTLHAGERALEARLAKSVDSPRVGCKRTRRATLRCRWSGRTPVARCSGVTVARRSRGRWRYRNVARRCTPLNSSRRPAEGLPQSTMPAPEPPADEPPAEEAPAEEPPPVEPPAPRPAPLFGFNDNAIRAGLISAADDAELTDRVGANVHRLGFDWRWVEPTPGEYHWDAYDEIYREMTARGVRPLFILIYAPSWALDAAEACDQWQADCRYPPGREHYDDWRRMAAAIAQRYPDAAGIEIWNEPNERMFWLPGPQPKRYAELLGEAYAAVKEVDPSMPVLGGSVSNRQGDEEAGMTQVEFLERLYDAGGGDAMDGISVHPYPWSLSLDLLELSLAQVREIRDSHGDTGKPLWVTEVGLSTTGWDPRFVFTPEQQAWGLAKIYESLAAMDDVRSVIVHSLIWSDGAAWEGEAGYPVLNADHTPKPAYCALAALRGNDGACPAS